MRGREGVRERRGKGADLLLGVVAVVVVVMVLVLALVLLMLFDSFFLISQNPLPAPRRR